MDNVDVSRMQPKVVAVLLYDAVTISKLDGEDTHPEYDKTSGEFVLLLLARVHLLPSKDSRFGHG